MRHIGASGRLRRFAGRVMENIVATVVVGVVASGAILGILQATLGLFDGHVEFNVPTWTFVAAVLLVFALGLIAGYLTNHLRATTPMIEAAGMALSHLEAQDAYVEHIGQILDQLQNAIDGQIEGVTVEDFIERGVLQSGRDMLKTNQRSGEDVRLSVLCPDGEDFVMTHSAGHTPVGHARFRLRIADSFSRHAYEQGIIVTSPNVEEDERFTPHPRASRPYRTIVSIPLKRGGQSAWIFNAIFTADAAINITDYAYIVLIGAIINVALVAEA